jgi:hypothetical protein
MPAPTFGDHCVMPEDRSLTLCGENALEGLPVRHRRVPSVSCSLCDAIGVAEGISDRLDIVGFFPPARNPRMTRKGH